jgi:hypothetical protein
MGDIEAYKNTIEQVELFGEIKEIGSSIEFNVIEKLQY